MNDHEPLDLTPLDPGTGDPGYWDRNRATVMARAQALLSARRRAAPPSLSEVILGWGRVLLPAAAAAALLASLALFGGVEAPAPAGGPGAAPPQAAATLEDLIAELDEDLPEDVARMTLVDGSLVAQLVQGGW